MRRFSEEGVKATTVSDIEREAGLSPGAGGIYRHFGSKVELLETGVRDALDNLGTTEEQFYGADFDLRDFLTLYVRGGLVVLRHHRPLLRLLYRDLAGYPDLFEETKRRLVWVGTAEFAKHLREYAAPMQTAEDIDFEGVAAVFAGAVVNVAVIEALLDTPAPVDDDRFVSAWVDTLASYLDPGGER